MQRGLTRAQSRDVDRKAIEELGFTGLVLMENAGRGCAELLLPYSPRRVVICCGRGNNGGDGFVIARHLALHGVDVHVLLLGNTQSLRGDARANFEIVQRLRIPFTATDGADCQQLRSIWARELASADWVVDALLGTGTQGEINEPYRTAIELINASGKKVLAVDLPSGLDCDAGEPLGICVRAQLTGTFVARKIGFDNPASEQWTGDVKVLHIGVPLSAVSE
ncbi:MAG: NAD(P)H-hydrate epimerase [Planctomycetaceae bacterium]|nr:NAD(P)H-hydrate epimerase [Planctomycetaceae bacterium]